MQAYFHNRLLLSDAWLPLLTSAVRLIAFRRPAAKRFVHIISKSYGRARSQQYSQARCSHSRDSNNGTPSEKRIPLWESLDLVNKRQMSGMLEH